MNNELVFTNEILNREWNYEKNGSPSGFSHGSLKKVWWKCSKCGYEWQASLRNRNRGTGCPLCANKQRSLSHKKKTQFLVNNKALFDEFDSELNKNINPTILTLGSHKKVWWKCSKCGNKWEAIVSSRNNGSGCPYCSGRIPVIGINDLKTTNPVLIEEWDYDKNPIKPETVMPNSHNKVWWKCKECGYSWQAAISDRVNGNGCPNCSRSFRTSSPEQIIYYYFRQVYPDTINSYKPKWIGNRGAEIDVFIPSLSIGIEYDGYHWHRNADKDIDKVDVCRAHNITLIRVREQGCPELNIDSVIHIKKRTSQDMHYMKDVLDDLFSYIEQMNKISVKRPDIDIDRDMPEILVSYSDNKKKKSLEAHRPDVSNEWNYNKNGSLLPSMVSYSSNKKAWWKCSRCGYEWSASINNKIKRGCPACAGKSVWKGHNDLKTLYPSLANEWNCDKNNTLTPDNVTKGYDKKVWWKCSKCGYEWQAPVYSRTHGTGCPNCANKIVLSGVNDLAYLKPELMKEWSFEKNKEVNPHMVSVGTTRRVWWKCSKCGHEWQTSIRNRARLNSGCPVCANRNRSISIVCVETSLEFDSINKAHLATGISSYQITKALNKDNITAGGYHWRYQYEEEIRS